MILYKNTGKEANAVLEREFYDICHVIFLAGIAVIP
jgi:hypothetical protein